jgi:hypothetical protein
MRRDHRAFAFASGAGCLGETSRIAQVAGEDDEVAAQYIDIGAKNSHDSGKSEWRRKPARKSAIQTDNVSDRRMKNEYSGCQPQPIRIIYNGRDYFICIKISFVLGPTCGQKIAKMGGTGPKTAIPARRHKALKTGASGPVSSWIGWQLAKGQITARPAGLALYLLQLLSWPDRTENVFCVDAA